MNKPKELISAREALLKLNVSLHQPNLDDDLVLLKVITDNQTAKTARITGINAQQNTLSYQPVHIYFNDNGRREIVPAKQGHICSLDDKVFL
jgi:hypothetical protein